MMQMLSGKPVSLYSFLSHIFEIINAVSCIILIHWNPMYYFQKKFISYNYNATMNIKNAKIVKNAFFSKINVCGL